MTVQSLRLYPRAICSVVNVEKVPITLGGETGKFQQRHLRWVRASQGPATVLIIGQNVVNHITAINKSRSLNACVCVGAVGTTCIAAQWT